MDSPPNDHSVNDLESILPRAARLQWKIEQLKKSAIEVAKETQQLKKENNELRVKIEAFEEKVARRESRESSESTTSSQYYSEGDGYTDTEDDGKSVVEGEGLGRMMGRKESDSSLHRGFESRVSPSQGEDQGLEEMEEVKEVFRLAQVNEENGEEASEHGEPHNINATVTRAEK